MEYFNWLIKELSAKAHIKNQRELSKKTGINYWTLRDRIDKPGKLQISELIALDEILNFTDEQLLTFYQHMKSQF